MAIGCGSCVTSYQIAGVRVSDTFVNLHQFCNDTERPLVTLKLFDMRSVALERRCSECHITSIIDWWAACFRSARDSLVACTEGNVVVRLQGRFFAHSR